MEKKIVSADFCKGAYLTKSSSAFVENNISNGFVTPEVVKIDDMTAWAFYNGNDWVNAVINRIISDTVKHRPVIAMRDKNIVKKRRHQMQIEIVNDLIFNPNNNKESFRELRIKFLKDLLVIGRAAMEKVVDPVYGVLQELYSVQAKNIKLRMDEHGNYLSVPYQLVSKRGKTPVDYTFEELMYSVLRPTTENVYGEKPLDALANTVAADIIRAAYNTNFFINGAEASGILSLKEMGKGELNKFRDYWAQNHKGYGNSHKLVTVNVPIEYVRMAVTNKDMEFIQYGVELKSKIYSVFSMQPFIMGDISSTTGKLNSSEQKEIYMDGAITPLLDHEATVYTKEILHAGLGFTDLEVTFPGASRSDVKTQSEIDREDVKVGTITINEVREARGLPPVKWGDAPIVMPGGKLIDPKTGQLIDPKQQDNGKPKNNTGKNNSNASKKSIVDMVKFTDDIVMMYVTRRNKESLVNSIKRKIVGSDALKETLSESIVDELTTVFKSSKNIAEVVSGVDSIYKNYKGCIKC